MSQSKPIASKPVAPKIDRDDPDLIPFKSESSPKFFQNKRMFLTYSTHIDKQALITFVSEKMKLDTKFIRAAHEDGTQSRLFPYAHTHLLIWTERMFVAASCHTLDFPCLGYTTQKGVVTNVIHPHMRPVLSTLHWKRCQKYLSKQDPDNIDLANADSSLAERIGSAADMKEVMIMCEKASDAAGMKLMFEIMHTEQDNPEYEEYLTKLYDWQIEFVFWSDTPSYDNGSLFDWWCQFRGQIGKTQLTIALFMTNPKKYYVMTDLGCMRDAATVMDNARAAGWSGDTIILNLTRFDEHNINIWKYIESVRDGLLTAVKYMGKPVVYKCKRLVIFANFLPQYSRISVDRWRTRVYSGRLERFCPLSIMGALAVQREVDEVIAALPPGSKKELPLGWEWDPKLGGDAPIIVKDNEWSDVKPEVKSDYVAPTPESLGLKPRVLFPEEKTSNAIAITALRGAREILIEAKAEINGRTIETRSATQPGHNYRNYPLPASPVRNLVRKSVSEAIGLPEMGPMAKRPIVLPGLSHIYTPTLNDLPLNQQRMQNSLIQGGYNVPTMSEYRKELPVIEEIDDSKHDNETESISSNDCFPSSDVIFLLRDEPPYTDEDYLGDVLEYQEEMEEPKETADPSFGERCREHLAEALSNGGSAFDPAGISRRICDIAIRMGWTTHLLDDFKDELEVSPPATPTLEDQIAAEEFTSTPQNLRNEILAAKCITGKDAENVADAMKEMIAARRRQIR